MKAYLAGPINGCTDDEASTWRDQVRAALGEDRCIDPMRRDYRGIEDSHVQEIIDGDLTDIMESSVVIADCGRPSWGTAMELWFASHSTYGSPVVAIVPRSSGPVSPWLRLVSTYVVHTIDEAIAIARQLG